ncbi:hypothetical protein SAMN05518668_11616 [Sphingobium sp. YR657]|nr:hypothetical protein SAMN05518668_11616 [Sphingobium sp. YR657]
MPKMSERDRLHELEARQLKIRDEVEMARAHLRERYALIVRSLPVERISEKDFRALIEKAVFASEGGTREPVGLPPPGRARKTAPASGGTPPGTGERSAQAPGSPASTQKVISPAPV